MHSTSCACHESPKLLCICCNLQQPTNECISLARAPIHFSGVQKAAKSGSCECNAHGNRCESRGPHHTNRYQSAVILASIRACCGMEWPQNLLIGGSYCLRNYAVCKAMSMVWPFCKARFQSTNSIVNMYDCISFRNRHTNSMCLAYQAPLAALDCPFSQIRGMRLMQLRGRI